MKDVIIIGAGITGLATAHHLKKAGKDFLVLEVDTKDLEGYQLKTLYYQQIIGIREFRHSISGNKSLLFYPNQNRTSLGDLLKKGLTQKYVVLFQCLNLIMI